MEVTPAAAGPAGLPRVLPSAPVRGLRTHQQRYGPPRLRGEALIGEVERSGLTGRGGAAFPVGRKLRSVFGRAGRRGGLHGHGAVLIGNGMESESASAKDAALLARAPHLVLDGVAAAAGAVGAVRAILAGGYFGTWLASRDAMNVPASPAALRAAGASFGAGILLVLPAGGCGLAETARTARYLAGQSAGQCSPCVHGLPAIAEAMEQIAFRAASERALRTLHTLCGLASGSVPRARGRSLFCVPGES